MMNYSNKFSCCLIGNGALLIQCGEMILEKGHTILGIISLNPAILKWADENKIPACTQYTDYSSFLINKEFDYLFSIVHLSMIPEKVVSMPKKMTINYHDALLPKYAGIHATSWALIHGQKDHGITWHVVSNKVDEGNILKQRRIEIEDRETAFTLNMKCYQEALDSFTELVDELSSGTCKETEQDLTQRSYFGKYKRPEAGGVISWDKTAEELDSFTRGLNFGIYQNELGIPKLALGENFFAFSEVEVLNSVSTVVPGTIVDIRNGEIVISTTSNEILIKDLKHVNGDPVDLSSLDNQLGIKPGGILISYTLEKREKLTSLYEANAKSEEFWATIFSTLKPAFIPWINQDETVLKEEFNSTLVTIPEKFLDYINQKGCANSLEKVITAAFTAFLLRIWEDNELDIGFSNKDIRNEIQDFEGLFASYVPLRSSLDNGANFDDYYASVVSKWDIMKSKKTYPLDMAVRYPEINSGTIGTKGASLPVVLDFVDRFEGYVPPHKSIFSVAVICEPLECRLFITKAVGEAAATNLIERFEAFLYSLSENPSVPVLKQSILPSREYEKVVNELNHTDADYPKLCMHQIFQQVAKERSGNIAAFFEGASITYGELDKKSSQLAAYLRNKGIRPGVRAGVFIERSLDLLVGLLGILKAGAAYVPLDPIYPKDRLLHMIEDAGLSVILTQHPILENLPEISCQTICMDRDWKKIEEENSSLPMDFDDVSLDDSAYVIFTSGSTGKPKGVEVLHKGLTNFLCSMAKEPGFNENDKMLALTTICFDISGLELYLPLISGGQVEILSSEVSRDGFSLKDKVDSGWATVIQATPATYEMLLAAGWETKVPVKILCGGEALGRELADKLLGLCDQLWNVYGPTETTIWSSVSRVTAENEITIGKPMDNTQFYILDRNLNPVPFGATGELYIGGDGVAKGYLNRPELTQERFFQNPFLDKGKIYKTGDLARLLPEGNVVCIGRADNQVKLRGFRIELGEIESALEKQEGISKAVVVKREDVAGIENLTAFIRTDSGTVGELDLIEKLKHFLPNYMVPSYFYILNEYPLTLNRKVDRKPLTQLPVNHILEEFGVGNIPTEAAEVNAHVEGEFDLSHTSQAIEFYVQSLENDLLSIIANLLKADSKDIDKAKPLGQYGFDSLRFTKLSMKIKEKTSIQLTPAIFYTYNNIIDITKHLLDKYKENVEMQYEKGFSEFVGKLEKAKNMPLKGFEYSQRKHSKKQWVPDRSRKESIAVIGVGGRLPQSEDLMDFWEQIVKKSDLISEIPQDRWDYRDYDENNSNKALRSNSKWGGFIKDVDKFDAAFFNISPREAELMDPQQRVFLETVWEAIEDSGYKPSDLSGTKTGVFAGIVSNDYWDMISVSGGNMDAYTVSGNIDCIVANRVSYLLNLTGVSSTIETACSSSMVAIHRAVGSIRSGECEMAIAGGVNLMLNPSLHIALSKNGMLNADGRCKAFDKSGNGYVRSEGAGVLILKPMSAALEDGDYIYGIIKGSYENHGGRTNSMTAPNPVAQAELVATAIGEADVDPSTVTYIEAHGTGTSLGDPIEVNGLKKAFEMLYEKWGLKTPQEPHCGIGSVKTNIGHLESAAGVAGLIKVLLAMKNGVLPGMAHFKEMNPYIELDASPFYIVNETKTWERLLDKEGNSIPRRAGVSSFGFGGSNAHVFVEEYDNSNRTETPSGSNPCIIVLSANNQERLKAYAVKYIHFIDKVIGSPEGNEIYLEDMAYTLQVGRESMDERLGIVASTLDELKEKLIRFEAGEEDIPGLYTSNVRDAGNIHSKLFEGDEIEDFVRNIIKKGKYEKLAQLWVLGMEFDWNILYSGRIPVRIPLPTYPFERVRYWLPNYVEKGDFSSGIKTSYASLHPFIDTNESTLEEQLYKKVLRKEEYYLKDHVVNGKIVFPAVAYLEMARAAGTLASKRTSVLSLKNNVWLRPLVLEKNEEEIFISLKPVSSDLVAYQIYSYEESKDRVVHAQGSLVYADEGNIVNDSFIPVEDIRQRCSGYLDHDTCYRMFDSLGFQYGITFRPIVDVYYNETESLAYVELPRERRESAGAFVMHPSMLEGGLQTVIGILANASEDSQTPYLPFGSSEVEVYGKLPQSCYVYMVLAGKQSASGNDVRKFHICITDLEGKVLVRMNDYSIRAIPRKLPQIYSGERVGYYKEVWEQQLLQNMVVPQVKSRLLVFTDNKRLSDELRNCIQESVITVSIGDNFEKVDDITYKINPASSRDYERLFEEIQKNGNFTTRVIHAWSDIQQSSNRDKVDLQLISSAHSVLCLVKALAKQKSERIRFVYAYFNDLERPENVGVSGLVKCLRLEAPHIDFKMVGLSNNENILVLAKTLLDELAPRVAERMEVRYTTDGRYVRTVRPLEIQNKTNELQASVKENGVYIITGGAGGLGKIFSEFLTKNHNVNVVLAGRSELSSDKESWLKDLERSGSQVTYIRADISNREDVERLVAETRNRFGAINGIIHAAGLIKDSLAINKTIEEMDSVIAPKVYGTVYLDEATGNDPLDFFVMFSSITSFAGNVGQSDYGYANGFMDGYSIFRESLTNRGRRKGKTLAINWGIWMEGGMEISPSNLQLMSRTTGITPLSTQDGLEAFNFALQLPESNLLVVGGDTARIMNMLEERAVLKSRSNHTVSTAQQTLTSNELVAEGSNILRELTNDLINISSEILKVGVDKIDVNRDIGEYGFDSLSNTELANTLNQKFNIDITPVLFFEYTTVSTIAKYLQNEYSQQLTKQYEKKPKSVAVSAPVVGNTNILEELTNDLIKISSGILKVSEDRIVTNRDISEYGFDSLSNTELANNINQKFNLDITPVLFFEYTTIHAIAAYLYKEYKQQLEANYGSKVAPKLSSVNVEKEVLSSRFDFTRSQNVNESHLETKVAVNEHEPIAIIGIGGVMPESDNLDEFWEHLINGRDLVTEVPAYRWDWKNYFGDPAREKNKTNSKWGGFLKEIDKFDASFFKISPHEAALMDPQHRIYLEVVWQTIEDAGYKPSDLWGTETGLYVGLTNRDYLDYLRQNTDEILPESTFGNNHSFLVNRISYTLNLHGPSEPIDTLCSSSLTAIHRAVTDIRAGNCEMAIAGGISIIVSPNLTIAFNKAGMLSKDGKCMTFDTHANGFVRGEGAGAILLKPLKKAEADGDRIYAVIRGTAENHGGRGNSLTSPNVNAQANLIIKAFEKSGVEPETVTFMETHGTGTSLGDPIEINAMKKAYKELFQRRNKELPARPYCGLGTVKTNIGHLESAAGIAAIIKVLLSMKHAVIPPTIHFKELNPYIQLEKSPFYIANSLTPWERLTDEKGEEIPRRAGVSAFGAGGLNANILLEEYIDQRERHHFNYRYQVITISAKNEERLKAYAEKILQHLLKKPGEASLEEIAYTLQTGRESMEEKLAIVSDSIEQLIQRLSSFLEGQASVKGCYRNTHSTKGNNAHALIENIDSEENAEELAEAWVSGKEIEWNLLYREGRPPKISFPTYPFARERHWVESTGATVKYDRVPEIVKNSKDAMEGTLRIFRNGEPYMRDHTVYGEQVLLGVTYISMVAEVASRLNSGKKLSGLRNVVFSNPMVLQTGETAYAQVDIVKAEKKHLFSTKYRKAEELDWITSSTGECIFNTLPVAKPFDLTRFNAMRGERLDGDDVYKEKWTSAPVVYGPSLKIIRNLVVNDREAFGEIELTAEMKGNGYSFGVHPALLDGAVLCGMFAFLRKEKDTFIPFIVNDIYIFDSLPERCFSYARFVKLNKEVMICDVYILGESGDVLAVLKGLTCKRIKAAESFGKSSKLNENVL